MREKQIEKYLVKQITQRGGLCLKFVSPSESGMPDRLVMLNGNICFIETKVSSGKARSLQQYQIDRIGKQGFDVFVIDSYARVDAIVRFLEE